MRESARRYGLRVSSGSTDHAMLKTGFGHFVRSNGILTIVIATRGAEAKLRTLEKFWWKTELMKLFAARIRSRDIPRPQFQADAATRLHTGTNSAMLRLALPPFSPRLPTA